MWYEQSKLGPSTTVQRWGPCAARLASCSLIQPFFLHSKTNSTPLIVSTHLRNTATVSAPYYNTLNCDLLLRPRYPATRAFETTSCDSCFRYNPAR
jgi:hypothetical protein